MNKKIFQKPLLTFLFFTVTSIAFSQWEELNGPAGGYVRSIIFDGYTIYAATGGGVLASDNQGNSWSFRNSGMVSCDTKSLAEAGGCVFVSTDENVFRTIDHGMSWEPAGEELNGKYVKNIISCNGVLFAATYLRGIYRSADTGHTWTEVNNGFPAKYAYCLATDGATIFAGTYMDGMYRSTDLGNSWSAVNNGLNEESIMAVICFEGKVFASTLYSGVSVSSDNGGTWTLLDTDLPSIKGFVGQDGILYAASFGGGVYYSMDSGETWSTMNAGLGETDLWCIGLSDSVIFAGAGSGHVYKRNIISGNWAICSNSGFKACTGSLASSGSNLLAGTHGSGFYSSGNEGDNWTKITSIGTVEIRSVFSSGSLVFAGTDMLGAFRSANNGASFSAVNNGLNSAWIQAFTVCDGKLFAGSGEEGVFVTTNDGLSWNPVNNGLGSLNILSLAADSENVFAGTSDSGIFTSSDFGANWMAINNGLNSATITAIQAFNGYLLAGTKADGIYISSDLGGNWIPASNGLPEQTNIRCLQVFDSIVFAGTGNGEVFASFDYGSNWVVVGDGLAGAPVLSLWASGDYLYAGLNAGGAWKFPLSLITGIKVMEKKLELHIYPNPSKNEIMVVTDQIYGTSFISVYSMIGEEIMKLETVNSGTRIDINKLTPGAYLLKYSNNEGVSSAWFVKE
jgi:hypothetical protein